MNVDTRKGGTKRSTAPLGSPSPDLSPSLTRIVGGRMIFKRRDCYVKRPRLLRVEIWAVV